MRAVRLRIYVFENAHGRGPDADELRQLKEDVHKEFGERGYLLAKKGAADEGKSNIYTDEKLVVHAVLTALVGNRPVVILTNDEDVLEQFYKLCWLLDTHYRAMLLADYYHFDSSRLVAHQALVKRLGMDEVFEGGEVMLVERSEDLLWDVLPSNWAYAPIHCWVVGEKLSRMSFGAEREMARLLEVKAETRGLNTKHFEGRNCHIWLAPFPVPDEFRGCAAIATDKRLTLPVSPIDLPMLDVTQAVMSDERFAHEEMT